MPEAVVALDQRLHFESAGILKGESFDNSLTRVLVTTSPGRLHRRFRCYRHTPSHNRVTFPGTRLWFSGPGYPRCRTYLMATSYFDVL